MQDKSTEIAGILADHLQLTGLTADQVKIERMVGFSNDVFKVTLADDVKCPQIESNTMILKQKIKHKPNEDFIVFAKEVPRFIKAHKFGALGVYEDDDIVIEEFIPSKTCAFGAFKQVDCFFPSIKQLAEYCKLFRDHPDDFAMHNQGKTLVSVIIDKGIVERSKINVKRVIESPTTNLDKGDLAKILDWIENESLTDDVKKVIDSANKLPMMVCHNDFYWLNVLRKDAGGYLLIDYEYTAFNPIGWDIANYYTERNFEYDNGTHTFKFYQDLPGKEERSLVYKYYLLCLSDAFDHNTPVDAQFLFDLTAGKFDSLIDVDQLASLVDEASFMRLVYLVNLQWIYFNCVMLEDQPTWPLVEYTFHRIALHRHVHKLMTESQ